MEPATREYLTALVGATLLISFGATGAAAGFSIVPYWIGGWELVIKAWKPGAPIQFEWYTKLLGLLGLLAGMALGYGVSRVVWFLTGLMSHDEIRQCDRDLLGLIKHGRRLTTHNTSKQP